MINHELLRTANIRAFPLANLLNLASATYLLRKVSLERKAPEGTTIPERND
jgi:hypothetical protein